MRILFVASEVAPYSKTGGLADVAGALPVALEKLSHEVTVVTPLYAVVRDPSIRALEKSITLRFPFGPATARLYEARRSKRLRVVFVHEPSFFGRAGIYMENGREYGDNHRRFAFFSMAALTSAQLLDFSADVVHLNDWQTGLGALALRHGYRRTSLKEAKSLFTIHNLAYQGVFPKTVMDELGIPWELFTPDGLEHFDRVSFLKAGIAYSDALTTVSPRYAEEIQTPEGGAGLDGILRARAKVLHGILNGADYDEWNPATDALLPFRYDADDFSGKDACKAFLLERLGLEPIPTGARVPLFGAVTRLAWQKGIDLLLEVLPGLLEHDVRVVFLGSGEPRYEEALSHLADRFRGRMGVRIGFDPQLAHQIEAGSDFFLMPSLYEPCGLNQLYSLRYGAIPIVRAVGGLDDTVVDLAEGGATGIKFREYSPQALRSALWRALELYRDPERLDSVRRAGMAKDFSWGASAAQYEALYRKMTRAERRNRGNLPG